MNRSSFKRPTYERPPVPAPRPVRAMTKFLDKLQAFAATDLGVAFSVPKWEEHR